MRNRSIRVNKYLFDQLRPPSLKLPAVAPAELWRTRWRTGMKVIVEIDGECSFRRR